MSSSWDRPSQTFAAWMLDHHSQASSFREIFETSFFNTSGGRKEEEEERKRKTTTISDVNDSRLLHSPSVRTLGEERPEMMT